MAFLIGGANSAADTAFSVDNSCRFNDGDSPRLLIANPTAGTRTKGTFSTWFKRGTFGSVQYLFSTWNNSVSGYSSALILLRADDRLEVDNYVASGASGHSSVILDRLFRDPAAWYHVVVAWDTTQATDTNRYKIYVNGVQETDYNGTPAWPTEDQELFFNAGGTSNPQHIGFESVGSDQKYFDGYLAETVHIEGNALAASSFGEFDEDSPTIWKAKDVSGLTFGNEGFYLDYEDSGDLGDDESGNGNDFAETNLAATDQSTDTCTNNFATLNPLYKDTNVTYSEGNLQHVNSASWEPGWSTIAVSSGKWYFESKFTAVTESANNAFIGVCLVSEEDGLNLPGNSANSYGYENNGNKKNNSSGTSYGNTWTVNDIVGCYLDLDNGAIYFSKNGTVQASGDPTSGASKTNAAYTFTPAGAYVLGISNYYGTQQINYGNPVHSISSGNSDPNGYGNFEYDESGYYALCTKNLAEIGG